MHQRHQLEDQTALCMKKCCNLFLLFRYTSSTKGLKTFYYKLHIGEASNGQMYQIDRTRSDICILKGMPTMEAKKLYLFS